MIYKTDVENSSKPDKNLKNKYPVGLAYGN
jgi:hypothetical protein